ncbi:MAG TPA: hypothetical protein VGP69_15495 [Gaiellaceae bacterium]|nr:hypothetical protein [Gaiellaceae bacterium]
MRVRVALLVCGAALAAGGGAIASIHASLSLADRQPVVLKGRGFRPLERVRVTLETRVTRIREVRAGRTGSFAVTFLGTNVPHCGGMFAHARGAAGSLATLKIPLPACQPD